MRILDFIHKKLYTHNHEAQETWQATQPEIDALLTRLWRSFDNTRVSLIDMDANPEDLEIWERTYGIHPDIFRDTPEERRERVLERKRDQPPFTEMWLKGNEYDNYGHRKMGGVIGLRFPEGDVYVALVGLRLYLVFDISGGRVNEFGFTCREFRELIPWFRGWMPTNLHLFIQLEYFRDTSYGKLFVGGRTVASQTLRERGNTQRKEDTESAGSLFFVGTAHRMITVERSGSVVW